jgi:hypothetical protein
VCGLTSVRGLGDTTTPLRKIEISIGASGWRGCDDFKRQRKLGNRSSCFPSASILGASSLSLSLSVVLAPRAELRQLRAQTRSCFYLWCFSSARRADSPLLSWTL